MLENTAVITVGMFVGYGLAVGILFTLLGMVVCGAAVMMHVLNRHPTLKRLRDEDNS